MGNLFSCIDDITKQERRDAYDMSEIKAKNLPIVWLLGPPGSGRTTQSYIITERFGYELINVSELIKNEAKAETERGLTIKNILDVKNRKIPDELVVDIIKEDMLRTANKAVGYVINGFPKTHRQASLFVKEVKDVDVILYLYLETLKMVARLQEEDKATDEDEIKNNIFAYVMEIKEATAKYSSKVEKIYTDGEETDVFRKIEAVINMRLKTTAAVI